MWYCNYAGLSVATFDGGLELVAAHLPGTLDDPLFATLFWRATAPVETDYTVFVHIVDAAGRMIGQWDQVPGAGSAPTSGWTPGTLIADDYRIDLDLAAAQSPVRVIVGLYDPATGERLPVLATSLPSADNAVDVRSYP